MLARPVLRVDVTLIVDGGFLGLLLHSTPSCELLPDFDLGG
jgi:hypothetical protein